SDNRRGAKVAAPITSPYDNEGRPGEKKDGERTRRQLRNNELLGKANGSSRNQLLPANSDGTAAAPGRRSTGPDSALIATTSRLFRNRAGFDRLAPGCAISIPLDLRHTQRLRNPKIPPGGGSEN